MDYLRTAKGYDKEVDDDNTYIKALTYIFRGFLGYTEAPKMANHFKDKEPTEILGALNTSRAKGKPQNYVTKKEVEDYYNKIF